MQLAQQVIFTMALVFAIWLFIRRIKMIRRNILLGTSIEITGSRRERWKKVLLYAVGQKKMFRYPLVAVLHLIIYLGFIIINIEVLEIVLDGILGTHRLFSRISGALYRALINSFEVLAFGVLVACIVFLLRRNVFKVRRLNRPELNGWPRKDANIILLTEMVLMALFLTMNAADEALQIQQQEHYPLTGSFLVSGLITDILPRNVNTLTFIERSCWWLHILGILAFLNYLPFSKHLHIVLAFPNTWYAAEKSSGWMPNMKAIQQEVLYAMQPELAPADAGQMPVKFGAKDITDLSWKNLMDAYSCTECGRCSAACPATITGKKLSPRKIMMDTRDRMEEAGRLASTGKQSALPGKTLLHDYITTEELRACTTCQACVEACPVSINPLDIILELRRHLVMEESNAPQEWNSMFSNIENNFSPWKFNTGDRDKWMETYNT